MSNLQNEIDNCLNTNHVILLYHALYKEISMGIKNGYNVAHIQFDSDVNLLNWLKTGVKDGIVELTCVSQKMMLKAIGQKHKWALEMCNDQCVCIIITYNMNDGKECQCSATTIGIIDNINVFDTYVKQYPNHKI